MKKIIIVVAVLALVFVSSVTVLAVRADARPAGILEEVTGLSREEIWVERYENGKTAGEIAENLGKLKDYKSALIKFYTENINLQVESGRLAQKEADKKLSEIKDFIENATSAQLDNSMGMRGRRRSYMAGCGNYYGEDRSDFGMNYGPGMGMFKVRFQNEFRNRGTLRLLDK